LPLNGTIVRRTREDALQPVDQVIRELEDAFLGVPLGKITLHEAEALESYATDVQRRAARELDRERDWRDVPDQAIRECPAALSFLDPESWRFYLPAYIRYGLRYTNTDVVDDAIYALNPAGIRQHEQVIEERFGTLNAAQVRAVCSFLLFASRNGDWCDDVFAKEALDDYWSARGGV
jgi:hypothetical protein